jgi:hypothetical protein
MVCCVDGSPCLRHVYDFVCDRCGYYIPEGKVKCQVWMNGVRTLL